MHKFLLITALLLFTVLPLHAQESNLLDACVTDFDESVDYFPEKAEITDAGNFTVEYANHYKVVTVTEAFEGAPEFEYVLVQCGTPTPSAEDFPDGTQFIEIPTGNLITLSTTQLPPLTDLGLLDFLVGVDSFDYINAPEVLEKIEAGEVEAVGFSSNINVELVLSLEPDLVLTYGYDPTTDAYPVLIEAGIFTALDASWREASPLGRAEWVKFTGLFYNEEAQAEAIYENIKTQYEDARELAQSVPEEDRPTVLVNSFLSYADGWYIPGEQTYIGQLIADAGGVIALADDSAETVAMSLETVYDGALDADIWLTETFAVNSVADMLALDSRYADFEALQSGNIWNNNRDENANGGNNYFELGVGNPHLILQDLVAIFHADLLPEHEFAFYQPLVGE